MIIPFAMTSGFRTRLTRLVAWLGLVAMSLVVAAPTVSWLIEASSPGLAIPVCTSADQAKPSVPDGRIHVGEHYEFSGDALNACGYCSLFADSSFLPALPPAAPAVLLLALLILGWPRWLGHVPLDMFPSGRPRDPPRFS